MKIFGQENQRKQINQAQVTMHSWRTMLLTEKTKRVLARVTAMILLDALLLPLFVFAPLMSARAAIGNQTAGTALVEMPITPVAPPAPFVMATDSSSARSLFAPNPTLLMEIGKVYQATVDFFTAPDLPAGLAMAQSISPAHAYLNSFAASISGAAIAPLDSLLAFFGSASAPASLVAPPAPPQPPGSVLYDFDGDGKADISTFASATGIWKIKKSSDGTILTVSFGATAAAIAPADYDGDHITDCAVFANGTFAVRKSSTAAIVYYAVGAAGDTPAVGDYDGDGLADAAVFRPSNGQWIIRSSITGTPTTTGFGQAGDIPVAGNYDGDTKTDIAVFRPNGGVWHIQGSQSGYSYFQWGVAADTPVPADYDGDGITDFGVYRAGIGTWYVHKSSAPGQYFTETWGNYGDQPVPADYDADGKADFAVWRPTTGVWFIDRSLATQNGQYSYYTLGAANERAVPAAYLKQVGGQIFGSDLAKARLAPKNQTGGTDLYSQNFAWSTGIVGLPGRAGLDAGLGISYNSLVWTKQGSAMIFDADNNVSPGFRLGFATIEPTYYDQTTGKFAYLMVTASGARVEFRQTAASDTFETADSSYAQLKVVAPQTQEETSSSSQEDLTLVVSGTDGTRTTYTWKAGAYRLAEIKDRNGNFITVNHDAQGLLRTVTDTLGRVITINYDAQLDPISVVQTWKDNNGAGSNVTHTYATFTYQTAADTNTKPSINTNFTGLTVFGPANGTDLKVLKKITFPTETNGAGPSTVFDYNSYGQVKRISNYAADNHLLNYTRTNLDTPAASQSDCPRFTETASKAENFNNNQEVVVTNSLQTGQSYSVGGASGTATLIQIAMTGHPNAAVSKTFVGETGWKESLPLATEDWADGARKRWTMTQWTQDDTNISYILNPRVTESKVGDTANIKRTTIDYYLQGATNVASYGLVKDVKTYDGTLGTLLQQSHTDYNLNAAYVSRRIIGLPANTEASGLNTATLVFEPISKMTYQYDEDHFDYSGVQQNIAPVQHDNVNYGTTFFIGRGNLTSTTRYDVTGQTSAVTSSVKYNTAGASVAQIDPLGRTIKIGYADSFNDTASHNTYAYPTTLTDPANNSSTVKYRFDIGANVWAESPAPAGNTTGKISTRLFDTAGRLQKQASIKNGAEYTYSRYEYPTNNVQSLSYATVTDTDNNGVGNQADEVRAESWTDGAGRVRIARAENPGSAGGWTGSRTEYDILGRTTRTSVPTEINESWNPSGDDYRGTDSGGNPIWLWTMQKYDWKGRVVRKINTDGVDSPTLNASDQLFSYDGCGCAGGQVTTVQGELVPRDDQPNAYARRTQKLYADVLGRTYKTEIMNWDNTAPYTSTVQKFNGRDQVIETRQYAGAAGSATSQLVTITYDGHGRMKTRHYPIEDGGTATQWSYNADDSIQQMTDPRGATTNFTYNDSRGLLTNISYGVPTGSTIPVTSAVGYQYDALGNRTQMTDGTGTTTYDYDNLSRLVSESKYFTNLPNAPVTNNRYTIAYEYQIGGGLKSITDPFGSQVNYTNDKIGRLTSVAGTPFAQNTTGSYASGIEYRAFGQVKQINYTMPNETSQIKMEYDNRLRVSHQEVTFSQMTGGYQMKADFSYAADGRVTAKNDLLDDAWDRTMKYDFAGRLTFNQFGIGIGSGNVGKRVYEQTIAYDAFSMMTSRTGTHWGEGIFFSETYTNGRIQARPGMVFDAAGNIVQTGSISSPDDYQQTTFDASGRRTAFHSSSKGQRGNDLNLVTEQKNENIFDGDGRPVIEKKGYRTHSVTNPPSTPLTTAVGAYQVWSSVLGSSLSRIAADGTKEEMRVFAGGALIAKQRRNIIDNQMTEVVEWTTADPVTGTVAPLGGLNEEHEPLGQEINSWDPSEPPNQSPSSAQTLFGGAGEPEWQCEVGLSFYGSFEALPWHCQKAALEDTTKGISEIYGPARTEENPLALTDSSLPKIYNTPPDARLAFALRATAKDDDDDINPESDNNRKQREFAVEVKGGSLNMSEIPGFVGANIGDNDDWKSPFHFFSSDEKLSDEDCDTKLSRIFGGFARAMENGDMRLTAPISRSPHSAGARNDLPATITEEDENGKKVVKRNSERGGIIHIYTDDKASPRTDIPLFAPGGWIGRPTAYYQGGNSGLIFNYAGGITIEFVHAGTNNENKIPTSPENNPGVGNLQEIGFVGGYGGTTKDYRNGESYNHTHITFFSNKAKNERIDPRVLFCGF